MGGAVPGTSAVQQAALVHYALLARRGTYFEPRGMPL